MSTRLVPTHRSPHIRAASRNASAGPTQHVSVHEVRCRSPRRRSLARRLAVTLLALCAMVAVAAATLTTAAKRGYAQGYFCPLQGNFTFTYGGVGYFGPASQVSSGAFSGRALYQFTATGSNGNTASGQFTVSATACLLN